MCTARRHHFSVHAGTILGGSHIPLRKRLPAIWTTPIRGDSRQFADEVDLHSTMMRNLLQ